MKKALLEKAINSFIINFNNLWKLSVLPESVIFLLDLNFDCFYFFCFNFNNKPKNQFMLTNFFKVLLLASCLSNHNPCRP